ncbi:MAG: acyl-CoA dehydrogenase family protein, partial [Proteobacteria bacterium]|nr:acyl-CoA dehydrogenase family protein [Pseudomonadota bacterium]
REVVLPTAAERDRNKEFPAENLKKMGELGLMAMNVPPEYNGAVVSGQWPGGQGGNGELRNSRSLLNIECRTRNVE